MDYTASYDNRVEVNKCSLMLSSASVKMIHFWNPSQFSKKLTIHEHITKKYEKILDYKYRWISLFCLCKSVMLCFIWIFHLLSLHFILVLFSFYRYKKCTLITGAWRFINKIDVGYKKGPVMGRDPFCTLHLFYW